MVLTKALTQAGSLGAELRCPELKIIEEIDAYTNRLIGGLERIAKEVILNAKPSN